MDATVQGEPTYSCVILCSTFPNIPILTRDEDAGTATCVLLLELDPLVSRVYCLQLCFSRDPRGSQVPIRATDTKISTFYTKYYRLRVQGFYCKYINT